MYLWFKNIKKNTTGMWIGYFPGHYVDMNTNSLLEGISIIGLRECS